ncbi:Protein N-acetyltransferase, RimJ/RimL family [Bryocella elongata]|uniref:Protein N-acetyltransferase, RimJ/RimL family n=1 Tax=Bryocella elongata TaxID=863522 RepID=A0A1H6BI97_9BACT|nr:GNAT family N-acetyltransferase [Bryocella elongata]SEG60115.1 Protein N-acetyltransferase, RimJ/RimL family [Bryocella elongata]
MPATYFLTTLRLGFRHWSLEDLPLARELWSDPGVMRFMGGPMNATQSLARFELEMSRQQRFGFCYWPIELLADGSFAGVCGLRPYHDSTNVLEVGVHVHPRHWSLRLGEEAARGAIAYAFDTLHAEALIAGHGPGHTNSQQLIERLGFRFSHEEPWGADGVLHPFYELRPER